MTAIPLRAHLYSYERQKTGRNRERHQSGATREKHPWVGVIAFRYKAFDVCTLQIHCARASVIYAACVKKVAASPRL